MTQVTAIRVSNNVAQICREARVPLSEDQELLLMGALAVWLEKARAEGHAEGREEAREDFGGPACGTIKYR